MRLGAGYANIRGIALRAEMNLFIRKPLLWYNNSGWNAQRGGFKGS